MLPFVFLFLAIALIYSGATGKALAIIKVLTTDATKVVKKNAK